MRNCLAIWERTELRFSSCRKILPRNAEAQKETSDVRDEENAKFKDDNTENEQCLVALEQAIKLMTGAGAGSRASRL